MPYPIRTCVKCSEEFELKPDKPGFANRCLACSTEDEDDPPAGTGGQKRDADDRRSESEANEARRKAIRDLLYRKES